MLSAKINEEKNLSGGKKTDLNTEKKFYEQKSYEK